MSKSLLAGAVLCAALFVFVGCPDGGGTNGAARPVITLRGSNPLLIDMGGGLSESGFGATAASANDSAYAGTVSITIVDSSGTEVTTIDTTTPGAYIATYTASPDADGNTPFPVIQVVRVGDATPPVITLVGNNPLLLPIGGKFIDPGARVADNNPLYREVATPTGGDAVDTAAPRVYIITYTAPADAAENTPEPVTRTVRVTIDLDGDTLIDMYTLDDMNAIHNNLDGTSYQATAGGTAVLCGTDGATACTGYELMRDLDFDSGDSYASGTVNDPDGGNNWRPTGGNPDAARNDGWDPIGSCVGDPNSDGIRCGDSDDDVFTATFEGNGFTIANLYARGGVNVRNRDVGLFGASGGTIRRIGIVNALLYGGGSADAIGGLVGFNADTGIITASYATGNFVGRLAGDSVGGLVGKNDGVITASYATGDADGGGSGEDTVGGLVGDNDGTITASYATGDADGGLGGSGFVGGLVGDNDGTITASYATGDPDGGTGPGDTVGSLVGRNTGTTDTITASYGFGTPAGDETDGVPHSTDATTTLIDACAITQTNSSMTPANRWNTGASDDALTWDFGGTSQRPAVRHNGAIVDGQTDRGC